MGTDSPSVGGTMLDSRQLVTLLLTAVFVVWVVLTLMKTGDGRESLIGVLKSSLPTQISVPVLLVIGWNTAVVLLLQRVGYWNTTMLWDTAMFVLFGAVASLFKAAKAKYDRAFFVTTVATNASVMFFLAFLTNFYTLGWWDAVLVPLLVVVGMMVAFSADNEQYRQVHKFFSGVQAVAGLSLLAHAVAHVVSHFGAFATLGTLRLALLPLILSVSFVPLLFLLCTWIAYDTAFIEVRLADGMDKKTRRYAKWRIFRMLGLNLLLVQDFRRASTWELRTAVSRDDVDHALADMDFAV